MAFVHDTADVSPDAILGDDVKIWNNAQVRERAEIGSHSIISKNVYIDADVKLGAACKVQNNSSIYHGASIADGVFVGPHCALLNDPMPRAINADGSLKSADDWTVAGVTIGTGAALGGGTIVRPGAKVGAWAIVGAGSLVTRDIPAHALAYGSPARVMGFVDHDGEKMVIKNRGTSSVVFQSSNGFELEVPQESCEHLLGKE